MTLTYELCLIYPHTNEALLFKDKHSLGGIPGTLEASRMARTLIVNYVKPFHTVLGSDGLKSLEGMLCGDAFAYLSAGVDKLGNDVAANYLDHTEGNAKIALLLLMRLAALGVKEFPSSIWRITP